MKAPIIYGIFLICGILDSLGHCLYGLVRLEQGLLVRPLRQVFVVEKHRHTIQQRR